jgi:spore coat polysaccharide biosynthesis protein SpsF
MDLKIVAIIQARMSSSRLPGKVLMDIGGEPMLGRVVDRAERASIVQDVIVATSTEPVDDEIAKYCSGRNVSIARGSQFDVLDRYHSAALTAQADIVVRLTADCPLMDPGMIDDVVDLLIGRNGGYLRKSGSSMATAYDFAANRLPPPWKRTYPIGLDIEVCTMGALDRAWRESQEPWDREHVLPYVYEGVSLSQSGRRFSSGISLRKFRIAVMENEPDLGSLRWTVDTSEDLEFVRQVYDRFEGRHDFRWTEVLELLQREPQLALINAGVPHKTFHDTDERSDRGGAV